MRTTELSPPDTQLRLGEHIKARRERLKLSQDNLAERVGVSRFTVLSWEKNRKIPDLAQWRSLVDVLGLDYLADVRQIPDSMVDTGGYPDTPPDLRQLAA